MMVLETGARASAELVATAADQASALALSAEDAFPEVFATSRLVALMELAAARCMMPLLGPGQLSVGVNVNVSHLAATPKGVTVRAEATFTGMQGKLYCFEVQAWDRGGVIGQGSHTRAIIASERLLTGARTRNEVPAGQGQGPSGAGAHPERDPGGRGHES